MFMSRSKPSAGMVDSINIVPSRVTALFGDASARPKVAQVYNPRVGWSAPAKRRLLTEELMAELRSSGATLVDARWRSHRHRVR